MPISNRPEPTGYAAVAMVRVSDWREGSPYATMTETTQIMTPETSTYLDLVRFLAALTVCLGHLSGQRLTGGFLWQFSLFMSPAVDIFFVLSGFVIGRVTQHRERSPQDYAIARAARIYSVALPALVLTLVLDTLGRAIHPDLYTRSWGYDPDGQVWQFISGALFINQIWFFNTPQGSMLPYWSLGFEVWYYIIFGLAMFVPARWRILSVMVAIVFAGPRIAAMLPLWLLGLMCSRLVPRLSTKILIGWALTIGSFLGGLAYIGWAGGHGRLLNYAPVTFNRPELVEDYLIAVVFAANLTGFSIVSRHFAPVLRLVAQPISWLAGATFTLYLLHLPIAQFISALVPWPPQAATTRSVILLATLVTVFVVAEFTERRKAAWRAAFAYLAPRVAPAR